MKLAEALKILHGAPKDAPSFPVLLACGFTPLHLETFLAAHLQQALPQRRVTISTGLYEDVPGTLGRLGEPFEAAAIPLEWPDLDPRLGYRRLGGWGPAELADLDQTVRGRIEQILHLLDQAPPALRIALALPGLPLPPAFTAPGWQAGEAELRLHESVAAFAAAAAKRAHTCLVSSQRLALLSTPDGRADFKSDLLGGLPYTVPHASALAECLANLIHPAAPKKGLITDLDDTLWSGLVGETGAESVSWDLASRSQMYGLYQQLLRALAEQGVLIGIASKNDRSQVEQVFARNDILLPKEKVFPVEINWNAKSGSVRRILETWNVGADSVVFVDDTPMELDEVRTAHPGTECIRFPADNPAAVPGFLWKLRDLFGKERISEEDTIRLDSIRRGSEFQREVGEPESQEHVLAQADALLTFDFDPNAADPRILELVNKTNQFNLNGIRHTEASWSQELDCRGAFAASIAYQDKYGRLGKIAVIKGRSANGALSVSTWVMSCRAFARRIEYRSLEVLFERFAPEQIVFDFVPTPRNGPMRDFLAALLGEPPVSRCDIQRGRFDQKRPPLHHRVEMNP
jgi:FkbH-like protein